ncbi:MAG: hypothetical protein KDN22_34435 [Verrucomicrobiae bacterium]|nr:hypothetical protein [Verrucomicrobiae bacterium]
MDWRKWIKRALSILVPCGVIGLLLPIYSLQPSYRPSHVEAAAQGLRNAVKQYHLQYGSFSPLSPNPTDSDFTVDSDARLMAILLGLDDERNPRKIAFGEWREAGKSRTNGLVYAENSDSGILVDQWGNPFRIVMDVDHDYRLANPDATAEVRILRQTILVYSAGPDGDFDTWNDNITTW